MQGLKLWPGEWDKAITGVKGYSKAVVSLEPDPTLLGVGYIIGPRIASVMVGGGLLTALMLTPLIAYFGEHLTVVLPPGQQKISEMSAGAISGQYVANRRGGRRDGGNPEHAQRPAADRLVDRR